MYACICHAVTEDQVRACTEGASEAASHRALLRHVVSATRAGSGCGSCVNRLRGLCERQPAVSPELSEAATPAA